LDVDTGNTKLQCVKGFDGGLRILWDRTQIHDNRNVDEAKRYTFAQRRSITTVDLHAQAARLTPTSTSLAAPAMLSTS